MRLAALNGAVADRVPDAQQRSLWELGGPGATAGVKISAN
jgi:hypothetical protein